MDLRVAFRADASTSIGYGHVKRCLSLAMALRAIGVKVCLLARDLGLDLSQLANSAGVELFSLASPCSTSASEIADRVPYAAWAGISWDADANECARVLDDWRPDWVVVDHYGFDSRWHSYLKASLGCRIAAVDDLADRMLAVDLLIDQNLSDDHVRKYLGLMPSQARMLGGPRFALIDASFSKVVPLKIAEHVRSIGIFMGGVDAENLSNFALRACRDFAGFHGPIEIVVTKANPHAEELRVAASRRGGVSILIDVPVMAGFFARHDLQIGAGGGASWERCCLGAPTVAMSGAANQSAVLPALAARGAVIVFDRTSSSNEEELGKVLRAVIDDPALRADLSRNARALVDGIGARRVALMMASEYVHVRRAAMPDAEKVHRWRNDPATRKVSRDSKEIPVEEHLRWFQQSLSSPERCILVAQIGNAEIGIVRFDIQSGHDAEVSLFLDPALHGLGFGRSMLLAGEVHFLRAEATIERLIAAVLPDNIRSGRLFESCGYRLIGDVWVKVVDRQPPQHSSHRYHHDG